MPSGEQVRVLSDAMNQNAAETGIKQWLYAANNNFFKQLFLAMFPHSFTVFFLFALSVNFVHLRRSAVVLRREDGLRTVLQRILEARRMHLTDVEEDQFHSEEQFEDRSKLGIDERFIAIGRNRPSFG